MSFGQFNNPAPKEQYTEDTLFKVYDALREDAGLTEKQTRACIDAMRKRGILFREVVTPPAPSEPVVRGVQQEAVPVSAPPEAYQLQPEFPAGQPRGFAQYLNGPRDGQ